jgi:hypothetical protein
MTHMAWKLMRDDRIIAAIAEEARKLLRSGAPEAVRAVLNGVRNPEHKDHGRFVMAVLDRSDPVETRQQIAVTHTIIDPDTEALEELRACLALKTPHEKLLEMFGGNRLPLLLEQLEAADTERRASKAKVVEGEVIG